MSPPGIRRETRVRRAAAWSRGAGGFTLIELMVVISIVVLITVMLVPAFSNIQGSNGVTKAAYDVAGVLQNARAYAIAANTYVWVGFYEENVAMESTLPKATAGTGRVVVATVASMDGTGSLAVSGTLDATRLIPVNKPLKSDNIHLVVLNGPVLSATAAGTASAALAGTAFDTRPQVTSTAAQIGVGSSSTAFSYPVGSGPPTAQYTFSQTIQFNPRGEVAVNNAGSQLWQVAEVGLQPTHGTAVDVNNRNVVAIQITGVAGNVSIYRR